MTTVHIFRAGHSEEYGFTLDSTGTNLPASSGGNWSIFKTKDMQPGQNLIGASTDEILSEIADKGYHILRAGVRFEIRDEAGNKLE